MEEIPRTFTIKIVLLLSLQRNSFYEGIKIKNTIYINGRFLSQPITGVQRYASELLTALDELIEKGNVDRRKYSFALLAPKDIVFEPKLKNISLRHVGVFTGHLWEQIELPYYARRGLLLNPCNTAPLIKKKQVVTIHDVSVWAFPSTYSFAFRTFYKILLPCMARRSKRIITVSTHSKSEIIKYLRIAEEKINVIYHGVNHLNTVELDNGVLEKNDIGSRPYLLAVSSMSYHKNIQSVIHAVELLGKTDFDVIISGSVNPKVFGKPNLSFSSAIKYLGYVTDSELKALYSKANCFVYPSYYEGFGLPPLEAMACGCPVTVSNAASMPEVCGDAALYCDPYNPADIADKIMKLMFDEKLRSEVKQRGYKRASQFYWQKSAIETFSLIEEVIAS